VHLQGLLGLTTPRYYHVPIVVNAKLQKLSKQTGAPAVDAHDRVTAATVLELLGVPVPPELMRERPGLLWQWALPRFSVDVLRGKRALRLRPGADAAT